MVRAPAWDFLQLQFMFQFHGTFLPTVSFHRHAAAPKHKQQRQNARTSVPCSGSATEPHAPTCILHAPAWDPACFCINQSNTFFLSLTFSFSSGCSSYPLLTNPPKTYLYQKKILHTHLPNIHAFLTTIYLSLINFSLLTLPQMPNSSF